ncbi:unnamed protein product [Fraxinus pennsylvanica]|uniref:BAR domain-containing protein n=1 Tax=Fraxinus pennsylvanica TaxID=56036 RepID=A0AAD2E7U5_9LAMI|nr:unnamed protein product [Fraxinus pennsylvanica]
MKSPLRKLRNLTLHKIELKENWDRRALSTDGLSQAAKDMKDMRAWHDRLLSAAAATANSAYEFSESLLEMGNCLREKTAINDIGESGRALFMLGGVQLQLQKLLDSYRSHIICTITNPSESLLSELRKVEEMKLQCDEKREMFECMVGQNREKGRSRYGKGQNFTSQQLQVAREEYDEASRLCVFRLESLKQGQSRSLLTQAARHHAAQLNLFRRGFLTLEAVEPHIEFVARKQHIDYKLCGSDDVEVSHDERNSFQANDDGEISFDHQQTEELENDYTSKSSMHINFGKKQVEKIPCPRPRESSHSAPIYSGKFDASERLEEMQAAMQKLNMNELPTPAIEKSSTSKTKHKKSPFVPLPRPLAEGAAVSQWDTQGRYDIRKRQAISGPLTSKPSYNKPLSSTSGPIGSTESPQMVSGLFSRLPLPQPALSTNVSYSTSLPVASSPKINELHELPRPPDFLGSKTVQTSAVFGHSSPLVNRNQEVSPRNTSPLPSPKMGSPLPLPPATVRQCLSVHSSQQKAMAIHAGKLFESYQFEDKMEEVSSPPLTSILLSNMKSPDSRQDYGTRQLAAPLESPKV